MDKVRVFSFNEKLHKIDLDDSQKVVGLKERIRNLFNAVESIHFEYEKLNQTLRQCRHHETEQKASEFSRHRQLQGH